MERDKVDCISIQGYSHVLNNKECQDSSICWQEKFYDGIIVCDGHGGEKYIRSALGSKFACEIGKEQISSFMTVLATNKVARHEFLTDTKKREEMFSRLERSIIQRWQETIEKDFTEHPIEQDERYIALTDSDKNSIQKSHAKAYGSTFICGVLTDNYYFILKLGDGNACSLSRGMKIELIDKLHSELADDQLQFNLTTSLCNSDADTAFKHCLVKFDDYRDIQGLLITTDGIINCYKEEKGYIDFVSNIFEAYKTTRRKDAHNELAEFLPRLSEKGSGDDLSVAIICRKK